MNRDSGEAADLVLGQVERDRIGRDASHGPDRNRDLAATEEVTAFEHDVRNPVVAVDHEAADVAEPATISRDDLAGASDLDLPLRNAVVDDPDMGVEVERIVAETGVIRLREDGFDAHVPGGVGERELAEAQVGELLNRRETVEILRGAAESDDGPGLAVGAGELDGHEPGETVAAVRRDDEMRDAPPRRVDYDVGEFPEQAVAAVHRAPEFQSHDQVLSNAKMSVASAMSAAVAGGTKSMPRCDA
jgi:hypothetical protein